MKMKLWGLTLLSFGLLSFSQVTAQSFGEGQVWEYKTRPGETGSLLRIAKVDHDPKLGEVFHISIVGVKVKGSKGILTDLAHAPVARVTLEKSVTKRSSSNVSFPDFRPGYVEWKNAKGGVFNVTVAEVVSFVEQAFSGVKREP
ncbi:MAG: hypothetical protein OEN50_11605 [Deltaproteobacteria bacterium]|nr:hypothetical protein [Deltaproteobacteria bacterium]